MQGLVIAKGQHLVLFGSAYHQRDMCLFCEANNDQLPLVARHIHQEAWKSRESHLAPYPEILFVD